VAKKARELRLELLLGRRVVDGDGHVVGRLEEFRATREDDAWVVTEFEIGRAALLERLAIRNFGWVPGKGPAGYRARWDQIDLRDPDHPRLTVPIEELKPIRRR
jgi:hypothetical protein